MCLFVADNWCGDPARVVIDKETAEEGGGAGGDGVDVDADEGIWMTVLVPPSCG